MTYRELINLYKTGQLDEEQKEKVAKDIERQEAISEYLFDEEKIPGLDTLEIENPQSTYGGDDTIPYSNSDEMANEEQQFAKMIKASIRKAFIKMGVMVSVVVIAIVLFIIFILPKLVDRLYYNPLEVAGSEKVYDSYTVVDEDGNIVETVTSDEEYSIWKTDRLSLDMAVYSELFLPGNYADHVISDSRGYGVYDVVIYGSGYGRVKNVAGKIDKDQMLLYDLSVFNRPVVNAVFPQAAGVDYPFQWEGGTAEYDYMLDLLQNLEEDKFYGVYVTLSDVYSYSELMQWSKENETVTPQWCALCRKLDAQQVNEWDGFQYRIEELVGFVNGSSCRQLYYDKKAYPLLTQMDLSMTTGKEKDWEIAEEDMTTHVISTLRYMQDQMTFNEMMNIDYYNEAGIYQDMIDSIEKNGLTIYAFYGEATKEEILVLSKLDEVAYVYTVPLEY